MWRFAMCDVCLGLVASLLHYSVLVVVDGSVCLRLSLFFCSPSFAFVLGAPALLLCLARLLCFGSWPSCFALVLGVPVLPSVPGAPAMLWVLVES